MNLGSPSTMQYVALYANQYRISSFSSFVPCLYSNIIPTAESKF